MAKKTCERVQEIARSMGYHVSTPVSNWMSQLRSSGDESRYEVIVFAVEKELLNSGNEVVQMLFEGGRIRAEEHGYRLEAFPFDERSLSDERLSDILKARGIRGVVAGPLPKDKTRFDLDWDAFAAAGFDSYWWKPAMHRAGNDYYSSVLKGMDIARDRGYKRIGLAVVGEQDRRYQRQLSAAFVSCYESFNSDDNILPFASDSWEFDHDRFKAWLERFRLDCVIGSQKVPVLLDELGLSMPEDIGYISMNRSLDDREVAGFFHDFELMGASTVDHVISQLNRNVLGLPEIPIMTLIRPVWVDGPTIRASE